MKNFTRIAGIIALVSIIGLSFASCGGGAGGTGGNIPVLVKAYDNGGVAPVNLSIAPRAVGGGRGGPLRAFTTDTTSFKPLNDLYESGGDLDAPNTSYTPTEFNVEYAVWAIMDYGPNTILPRRYAVTQLTPHQRYDFTKGLTVDVGEIPAMDMTVVGLVVDFDRGEGSPVKFKDGSTTELAKHLARAPGAGALPIERFICYGDTRKYIPFGDEFIGPDGEELLNPGKMPAIVMPFEPKVISASATTSITLNISWRLNAVVGDFGLGNAFVSEQQYFFTKGWWDNMYIYASVN